MGRCANDCMSCDICNRENSYIEEISVYSTKFIRKLNNLELDLLKKIVNKEIKRRKK